MHVSVTTLILTMVRRVAHLSDVPYVLNSQRIGAKGDNSRSQLELGKLMSRSILKFVHDGDPVRKDGAATKWPSAFEGISEKELKKSSGPSKVNLHIFGGPYGNQPVTVAKKAKGTLSDAEQAVASEQLFERCNFINSDAVREEIGV